MLRDQILDYEKKVYEYGGVIDYCRCGHSEYFHVITLPIDEYIKSLEEEREVKHYCIECLSEEKNCVNFRWKSSIGQ